MTEQEMKGMNLHGMERLDDIIILRVIGGWIYWRTRDNAVTGEEGTHIACAVAGVFVPER